MIIKATFFGKTLQVKTSQLHNMKDGDTPDEILWIERPEDYYALMSPGLKDKKVACVERQDWLDATMNAEINSVLIDDPPFVTKAAQGRDRGLGKPFT